MNRSARLLRIVVSAVMAMMSSVMADDAHNTTDYTEPELTAADSNHWSFRPYKGTPIPETRSSAWCLNPVDRFIAAKLEALNVRPQPSASRRTLIRRVTLNLTGLPPSPEEVSAFENDESPTAYAGVINRLLAASAYGEHWAQHWLDLARFAETDGFEHDKVRPDAWKYRDWVIEAFNADMPYDEFVRQQIAGDLLQPEIPGAHTATHFSVAGPDMPDINSQEERRHTLLNGAVSTVGEVFLGMQVGCAACHDHKYDPISQADFYRLRAVFEPAISLRKDVSVGELSEATSWQNASHVLIRGDFTRPGPIVSPGIPRLFVSEVMASEPALVKAFQEDRRIALANWITSPGNPLTARVIVNRLWQQHFGSGLTTSPSDFGIMGQPPVNQELLDWLAQWFVENAWSIKSFHRLVMTSAAYQQRSRLPIDASAGDIVNWKQSRYIDPDARLLSRFPRQRLSGEVIRDAMLAASGSLNRKPGGPGIRPPLPAELRSSLLRGQWQDTDDHSAHDRRSIYVFASRNLRYPIFEAFDRPAANDSCPTRLSSTTAPQALFLMNSDFASECSVRLANVIRKSDTSRHGQVTAAFQKTLGRLPAEEERRDSIRFLEESPQASGLQNLCLSLFNSNEFVFID